MASKAIFYGWPLVPPSKAVAAPAFSVQPSISGTFTVGQTLTASNGTVTGFPVPTVTRQWLRDGSAISGATGATYVLTEADNGKRIDLAVSAQSIAGSASATAIGSVVQSGGVVPVKRMRPASHTDFDFPTTVSSSLVGDYSDGRKQLVNNSPLPITEVIIPLSGWIYTASQQFDSVDLMGNAGVEYPLGTKVGSTAKIVAAGTTENFVVTGVSIPPGATYYVNVWENRLSAGSMPFSFTTSSPSKLAYNGTDATDYTQTGTAQQPVVTGIQRGPIPLAVMSNEVGNPLDCFSLFGDSIMRGLNASWAKEGCIAAGFVPLQWSVSGSRLDQSLPALSKRVAAAKLLETTIALTNYGINDIRNSRTAAQLQANWLTHWTNLKAQGFKVYQLTITPNTTQIVVGSDWSAANQTPHPTFTPVIHEVNDWLRDGAPIVGGVAVAAGTVGAIRMGSADHPLTGIWDYADVVSTARNSGVFKDGYTNDGLHPFTLAAAVLIPAFTAWVSSIGRIN